MKTIAIITGLGLLILIAEIIGFKKHLRLPILLGIAAAFVMNMLEWDHARLVFHSMASVDHYSVAFSAVLLGVTFLWFLFSTDYFRENTSRTDHYALIVFALAGGLVMVSFNNLLMLFLGIEILSISMYILAGSNKSDLKSNEAALKYFLLGAFATGFLLFGIALLYGASGSFESGKIAARMLEPQFRSSAMVSCGILLMMVALAFKVSAVPFHFWAPDVYQGSPTAITAFMSTVVKTAGFAAFFRLFYFMFSGTSEVWSVALWIIAALTILVGNITAVYQVNLKRMLAYSSISHAGYMVLAILALNQRAPSALLFYVAAYSVSSLAAFAVLLLVQKKTGSENIEDFNGLASKNPVLAMAAIVSMLSLAGIPPTAGFFAKYYIFTSAIEQGYTGLVVLAIAGSLIGVFYYFRVIIALFHVGEEKGVVPMNILNASFLVLVSIVTLILGVFPGLVAGLL